jgi:hypothetical protein
MSPGQLTWTVVLLVFYSISIPFCFMQKGRYFTGKNTFILVNGLVINSTVWFVYELFAIKLAFWEWNPATILNIKVMGIVPIEETLLLNTLPIPLAIAFLKVINSLLKNKGLGFRIVMVFLYSITVVVPFEFISVLWLKIWFIPSASTIQVNLFQIPVEEFIWYFAYSGVALLIVFGLEYLYESSIHAPSILRKGSGAGSTRFLGCLIVTTCFLVAVGCVRYSGTIVSLCAHSKQLYFKSTIAMFVISNLALVTLFRLPGPKQLNSF